MEIKIISLFLIGFIAILFVWGILKIHTYPEKIAKQKNHPQTRAISVTAILGLLIFPLWMFALVWAYSNAIVGRLYNKGDEEKKPIEPSNSNDYVDQSNATDKEESSETDKGDSHATDNENLKNNS